eukprot:GHVU01187261.1.p2 GENE.GHVU01187261.1~~GHVU01187261.1.p2  ORF type:complete len:132 (+),score=7.25 GHVU01187261.1:111-506(+)
MCRYVTETSLMISGVEVVGGYMPPRVYTNEMVAVMNHKSPHFRSQYRATRGSVASPSHLRREKGEAEVRVTAPPPTGRAPPLPLTSTPAALPSTRVLLPASACLRASLPACLLGTMPAWVRCLLHTNNQTR